MQRSTKDAWLQGSGDLKEADVEDVPVKGQSVRVRALPATYSDQGMSDASETVIVGNQQIQRYNIGKLRVLQFLHGCIDPQFTLDEVQKIAEKYGPAFERVVDKVQELTGIDEEEVKKAEARFPLERADANGSEVADSDSAGSGRPDVPVRVGAGAGDAGGGAR